MSYGNTAFQLAGLVCDKVGKFITFHLNIIKRQKDVGWRVIFFITKLSK